LAPDRRTGRPLRQPPGRRAAREHRTGVAVPRLARLRGPSPPTCPPPFCRPGIPQHPREYPWDVLRVPAVISAVSTGGGARAAAASGRHCRAVLLGQPSGPGGCLAAAAASCRTKAGGVLPPGRDLRGVALWEAMKFGRWEAMMPGSRDLDTPR